MPEVLELLAVLAAGLAAAALVRLTARARPTLFHRPYRAVAWAVVAASAVGAAMAPVAPTGVGPVDALYKAGFAALVTFAAGRARREPRLIAGAIAAVGSAGAWPWNLVAFVALGLATGSASIRRSARPLGTIIGALQVQVLLRLAWPDVPYATALLAAVAALVLVVSGLRHARRHERRGARIVLGGLAAVGVVVVVLLGIGAYGLARDLVGGARAADRGLDAVRAAETGDAVEQLELADRRLRSAEDGFGGALLQPARYLPVLGRYLDIGEDVTSAAAAVVGPALDSARLADGDALRIRNAQVDLAAVESLRPPLVRTLEAVPGARAAVERLGGEPLPGAVTERIRDLDDSLARATDDGEFLLEALDLVPQLLGADGPRRWFVVMQTPSEQRASGGIAGGYGELLVEGGRLDLVVSGEGSDLNRRGAPWDLGEVAAEFERFGESGPARYFQNVTNVPHFPTVGRTITTVYPQAGGAPVDGVISVDPKVLGALISLTGPVEVPGWPRPLTEGNAERTLLYEQYLRLDGEAGRQFITDTIDATFDRLESTALPAPARVTKVLSPMVQAGRLKLYSSVPEEQAFFEEMGAAGVLPEVDGDFFQVVTQNAGQSKIDWFQRRTVSYEARHDPVTGTIDAVATVTISNQSPDSGESELLIGGRNFIDPGPPGRSRLYVDFWSALDLHAVTLDGQPIDLNREQAYGRNLYWTGHTLAPGETATFELYLSGLLEPGAPYVLDLGMQPVVRRDAVSVGVTVPDGTDVESADGLRVDGSRAGARFDQIEPRRFVVRSPIQG